MLCILIYPETTVLQNPLTKIDCSWQNVKLTLALWTGITYQDI